MNDTSENKSFHRAIIVVALGFLALALVFSARAALGLAMPIWENDLNWSRGYVSNVAAVALLIMAVASPISGFILDRKGLRFTLLLGLIAVFISCIVISMAQSAWVLLIGFGIIGGVGFGIVATHMVASAVARVYPENVGFASGIATSGSSAGQFLIVPLIALIFASFSWRWGFAGIAVGIACLIPLVWWVPSDKPDKQVSKASTINDATDLKFSLKKLFSTPVFHLLFWSYLICGYTTTGVIETHLMPFASFCGFEPIPSAAAYGLLSAVNLVGMISIGWLTDKMNRPLLLGCIYIIRGFTFWILLNVGTSYETLLLFAVIFGVVDYSTVPVTASLVASHIGLKVMGLTMGLLSAGHSIGAAIAASLGGYFFDRDATYDLIWVSSIALAIIAGVLAFLIKDNPSQKLRVQ
ncbi:MAG: MFS transporter [Pseudomonadales bacterium]|nr:MFS transporter [Pseudomonadales bacterium]